MIRIPDVCRLSYFHVFCRFPRISAYPLSGPPRAPLSTPSPPPPDRPPKTHRRHMGVGRTFTRATGETAQGVSVRGAAVAPLRVASRQVRASLRVGPPQSGHPRLGGGEHWGDALPPPAVGWGEGRPGKEPRTDCRGGSSVSASPSVSATVPRRPPPPGPRTTSPRVRWAFASPKRFFAADASSAHGPEFSAPNRYQFETAVLSEGSRRI